MRIMNKEVVHKRYGAGTVIAFKENKISVSFGKVFGDKVFSYPEVFTSDMRLMEEDLQEELEEDLGLDRKR